MQMWGDKSPSSYGIMKIRARQVEVTGMAVKLRITIVGYSALSLFY